MYRHPFVKTAFHISWFLLVLGGISLMEKQGWSLAGAAMLLLGLVIAGFTAIAIYMKKQVIKEPGWLLLLSLGMLALLVISQVLFQRYALAAVLAVLCIPIFMGWVKMRSNPKPSKSKK